MISVKYFPLKGLVVALAAAALGGGCAAPNTEPVGVTRVDDSTRTATNAYSTGRIPPPPAPAPAPQAAAAPAPAPEPPQEKTVVVAESPPPNAKVGECYTKVMLPAEYRDEPVQQLVRAAGERTEYTEPVYEEVEERIMIKPASKKVTVVPAEIGEVQEKVLVREAYRREIEVPALYNTYFEQVLEKPARTVWKPGRGAVEKVDPTTGEILCLVQEEAVYKTVEKKELARAASKTYQDVPAEYSTVKKTVVTKPESVQEVEIPAEYETRKVKKLTKAPEAVKVPVAAEYATVNKQVMVHPEQAVWDQVLCDINSTPEKIMQVESALKAQGYHAQRGRRDRCRTDRERHRLPEEERFARKWPDDRRNADQVGHRAAVKRLGRRGRPLGTAQEAPAPAGAFFGV